MALFIAINQSFNNRVADCFIMLTAFLSTCMHNPRSLHKSITFNRASQPVSKVSIYFKTIELF